MATRFDDTTADHKWSTAGNWSAGVPDATAAVTIGAAVTSLNIDVAATCLSIDMTGAASAFVLSGTGTLTVAGNVTYKASSTTTMTHSGTVTITDNCTFTSNGMTLGSAVTLATASKTLTLGGALNIAAKALSISRGTFSTSASNYAVTCGVFGDNDVAGTVTLTLGSSIINCTSVYFGSCTLTVTANTATVNISVPAGTGTALLNFGGKTWGGTTSISTTDGSNVYKYDASTFGNLTFNLPGSAAGEAASFVLFFGAVTVTGTFTINGSSRVGGPSFWSYSGWSPDSITTITAGSVSVSGGFYLRGIAGAGAASWDLSGAASGDLGGNTGITFRAPRTYYAVGAGGKQNYANIYSTSSGGAPGGLTENPLTQDTLIFDDNSFSSAGSNFYFHSGMLSGKVDASALTKATTLALPRNIYGDLIYTGSGITIPGPSYSISTIDARLKNERSGTPLYLNVLPSVSGNSIENALSYGGTVSLLTNNLQGVGTFTLTKGTLDLNGKTLSTNIFSSSNANVRVLKDTAGGGKIVITGVTGTVFDMSTNTDLTVSNGPAIDIGTGALTLTGDITFAGGGKTFGNFTVKKHAGNYSLIMTG